MTHYLVVLNDAPYGNERSYNGLRLARSLAMRDDAEVRLFLMGDAVGCAMADQKLPDGYYHLDRMLRAVGAKGSAVGSCGTCLDARGIKDEMLAEGTRRSSLDELTEWTVWADKVITF